MAWTIKYGLAPNRIQAKKEERLNLSLYPEDYNLFFVYYIITILAMDTYRMHERSKDHSTIYTSPCYHNICTHIQRFCDWSSTVRYIK